ncbi:unnamed protein product [Caenorhabditis brenneri]
MDADELREHLAYTCSEQSYIFVAHPIASTPMYNPERHLSSYRDIYNLFGKNFINFQRKTFMGDPIFVETFDVMGHSYLTHVPFEADRANFRRYLDIRRGWLMGYFHKEFFKTALRLLSLKKIYVNQIGTVEPTCDFNTWSKRLEKKCHDLNEKYPGFFCNRLQEFLTKVHKDINNEKLYEDEVDVVLPQKTEKLKEERPSSEWKLVIAQVEQYKQNYNCGFFYGVLDYWLINIAESMSHSLPEIYPFCSRENQRRLRCAKHARLPITCDAKDDDGPEVKKQKIAFIFEKPLPNNYNAFANYKPKRSHPIWKPF